MASTEPFSWSNGLDQFFVFRKKAEDQVLRHSIPTPKAHWRRQEWSIAFAFGSPPSTMDNGWGGECFRSPQTGCQNHHGDDGVDQSRSKSIASQSWRFYSKSEAFTPSVQPLSREIASGTRKCHWSSEFLSLEF